jgi:hypothetical protein
MIEEEPTKACIRVLKFENKVKYVLFYPFIKISKYFVRFIDWIFQFINWCIVRAIVRWIGPFVLAGVFYGMGKALSMKPEYINGAIDGTPFVLVMAYCFAIVVIGAGVLVCWIEIPEKEKVILTEYYKWL